MKQRCKRCGRFFASKCPYDEFCGLVCYGDDKAEKELWERRRAENLAALAAMVNHD